MISESFNLYKAIFHILVTHNRYRIIKKNLLNHRWRKKMLENYIQKCLFIAFMLGVNIITIGCTNVTVKPASTVGATGFRYYLPQPYLLVTPNEDGQTITVEQKLLPDYSRGYVIDGRSYFASHDVTVTTENGLLEKFDMTTDSTAVADKLLAQGGSIGTTLIGLEAKRKAAEKRANDSAMNTLGLKNAAENELKIPKKRYRPRLFQVKVSAKKEEKVESHVFCWFFLFVGFGHLC